MRDTTCPLYDVLAVSLSAPQTPDGGLEIGLVLGLQEPFTKACT